MREASKPTSVRHGQRIEPVPVEALLEPDPELRLVWADMAAWIEAHPCECHAGCECDEEACIPSGE